MSFLVPPPPTTNSLNSDQRHRLLRSTRKLGALLGTTPLVLEPHASTPQSSSSRRLPPPLVLRLNPVHLSQDDLRLPSPTSPTSLTRANTFPSPSTPTFSVPPPAIARRRKMAKLMRTLGENVPQELVFPSDRSSLTYSPAASMSSTSLNSSASSTSLPVSISSSSSSNDSSARPAAFASTRRPFIFTSATFRTISSPPFKKTSFKSKTPTNPTTPRAAPPRSPIPTTPPTTPPTPNLRHSRSRSLASVLSPSTYFPPPPITLEPAPRQYHYRRRGRPRSAAPFSTAEPIVIITESSPSHANDNDIDRHRAVIDPDTESAWVNISINKPPPSTLPQTNDSRDKQKKKEWSGQWNLPDISEVQKGLRALK